jgi:hypothetical protein
VKEFEEDVKEWAWFRFSDLVKVRWEPQADGTFELHVLVRFSFAFMREVVISFHKHADMGEAHSECGKSR